MVGCIVLKNVVDSLTVLQQHPQDGVSAAVSITASATLRAAMVLSIFYNIKGNASVTLTANPRLRSTRPAARRAFSGIAI
jgi:hypothetical protein